MSATKKEIKGVRKTISEMVDEIVNEAETDDNDENIAVQQKTRTKKKNSASQPIAIPQRNQIPGHLAAYMNVRRPQ